MVHIEADAADGSGTSIVSSGRVSSGAAGRRTGWSVSRDTEPVKGTGRETDGWSVGGGSRRDPRR